MALQIKPIQLNVPQVNFPGSVVTSRSNMNAPELNFTVATASDKGVNTYAMESFKFFNLSKFAKMLKTCFTIMVCGV